MIIKRIECSDHGRPRVSALAIVNQDVFRTHMHRVGYMSLNTREKLALGLSNQTSLEAEHYIVDTVNRWLSCLHAEDVNDVLEYDPVLRECPVISTSHLPPSHLEYLTLVCKSDRPWPPCVQYHFPEGFVINTTRAPRFPNAPECGAFGLLVVAFSLAGFTHFKLDADGPVIKQLPTFKYE